MGINQHRSLGFSKIRKKLRKTCTPKEVAVTINIEGNTSNNHIG